MDNNQAPHPAAPANGAQPQQPQYQAPQYQAPQYQAPQYQQPQYQQPQYQQPQYQQPQYQQPQYQAPQYQQPQYQQPQYRQPQYQQPQYQQPQYRQPQYQAPQYQQPQPQQPQYQQPQPQQPQYQQPQPQYRQPAAPSNATALGSRLPRAGGFALIPMILMLFAAVIALWQWMDILDGIEYAAPMSIALAVVKLACLGLLVAAVFVEKKPQLDWMMPIALLVTAGMSLINYIDVVVDVLDMIRYYDGLVVFRIVVLSLAEIACIAFMGILLLRKLQQRGNLPKFVCIGYGALLVLELLMVVLPMIGDYSAGYVIEYTLEALLIIASNVAILVGAWLLSEQRGR